MGDLDNKNKMLEFMTLGVNATANTAAAANFASLTKPEWAAGISGQRLGSLPLNNVLSLVALGAAFYNFVITVRAYQKLKRNADSNADLSDEDRKKLNQKLKQARYNCALLLHEFLTLLATNVINLSPELAPVIGFVVPYIFVAYIAPRLAFSLYHIGKELVLASKARTPEERSLHYQAAFNHAVTVGLQTLGMLLVIFMMINPISGVGFIPMNFAISLVLLTAWAVMKTVKFENTNPSSSTSQPFGKNKNTVSLAQWIKGKINILSEGKAYKDASLLGESPLTTQAKKIRIRT